MQIEFPALLVSSKKRSLFVVASESEFGKCTIQSLRNGYFELMDIYDSEGRHYKIDEVASYKPLSPFWYWPVEIAMYGSRLFKANFNAVLISNLDCKELKSELCDLAKKYRSNLDSGVGIEKIMEEIESSRTIKELINVFR
ncbi:hypothetical protein [Salmonella enterica]|uniref:hypothetical protein n=1 Tax=Salmonella TaxID=590 RepID=UPI000AA1C82F|nr:hypothetical protein [Salmonella enterica]MDG0222915.1 hypothetical protein [Salmonella enterica subsp. enterica]MDG0227882.1 hypothetical protein [Salmonella enterica subsp. enterica]MDG0232779.1 hypothetical protein [Salmonella enterica subsp. enterica]MDG0237894.1 hypothetical protein [Salmonella enterica subsp. enterica]MDG0242904.1 hypothetical protein [Salmonella enterica subsp. enterica]